MGHGNPPRADHRAARDRCRSVRDRLRDPTQRRATRDRSASRPARPHRTPHRGRRPSSCCRSLPGVVRWARTRLLAAMQRLVASISWCVGARLRRLRRRSTARGRRDNAYVWHHLVVASRARAIHVAQRLSVCHAATPRVGGADRPRPAVVRHAARTGRTHAPEPACDDARGRSRALCVHPQQVPLAFRGHLRTGGPRHRGGGCARPKRRVRHSALADAAVPDPRRLYRRGLVGLVSPRFLESVRSPHAHAGHPAPTRRSSFGKLATRDSGRRSSWLRSS